MCGIIAVVRRRSDRTPPVAADLLGPLETVPGLLTGVRDDELVAVLADAARRIGGVDRLLQGVPGVEALLGDRSLLASIEAVTGIVDDLIEDLEDRLDTEAGRAIDDLENVNAALILLKDAVWAVRRDRVRTARAVDDLAGPDAGRSALEAYTSIQQALSALDRLEVRGRDSAGLHVLVSDHGLDVTSPTVAGALGERADDGLFGALAVRTPDGHLSFVYKAAAEIGELGDNTLTLLSLIHI